MKGGDDNYENQLEENQQGVNPSGDPENQGASKGNTPTCQPKQNNREKILENGSEGSEGSPEETAKEPKDQSEVQSSKIDSDDSSETQTKEG